MNFCDSSQCSQPDGCRNFTGRAGQLFSPFVPMLTHMPVPFSLATAFKSPYHHASKCALALQNANYISTLVKLLFALTSSALKESDRDFSLILPQDLETPWWTYPMWKVVCSATELQFPNPRFLRRCKGSWIYNTLFHQIICGIFPVCSTEF